MAQLRRDYSKLLELKTEVLVLVPNGPEMIERYISRHAAPYPILTDKGSKVADQYFQTKHFFKFGTPTVVLVDQKGIIRYCLYASSLITEPDNLEPLRVLTSMDV